MNGMKSFVVVVATGLLTLLVLLLLWGLRGTLEECCKTMQDRTAALQKTVDEIDSKTPCAIGPPGRGPIIEVGPGGGAYAVWKVDSTQVTSWDTNHRIRSDAWGGRITFQFLLQGQTTGIEINRYMVKIRDVNNVEHTIEITKSQNDEIGWLLDTVPIDQCDMKPGGVNPLCGGKGLPKEFDGFITSNGYTPKSGSPVQGTIPGLEQSQVTTP